MVYPVKILEVNSKEVKERAWSLIEHSEILSSKENIDNYIEDAIIIAYEFEKKWRNKWEELQEKELNAET